MNVGLFYIQAVPNIVIFKTRLVLKVFTCACQIVRCQSTIATGSRCP